MKFVKAYLSGLKTTIGKSKLWLLLYALNFLFALALAFPLSGFLGDKLGPTLAADKFLEGFNFTIANDFMNQHGEVIGLVLNQSLVATILYLLLSVFLVGGILTIFKTKNEGFQFANFWSGCSIYFWRMLRLTVYFLIAQIILLALFFMLFSTLTAGGLERFQNESEIFQRGLILLPFYLFFATVFFMAHDYAKIQVVHTSNNWLFTPIKKAFSFILKNFKSTFLLYLLNLLTFGILFFLYLNLDFSNSIFLTFLIGQFFVISRIGTKLLNLASATDLYQRFQTK